MKTLPIALTTVVMLALLGCGGGDGGGDEGTSNNTPDNYLTVPATYTLNGSMPPSCPKASMVVTSKAEKEDDIGIHTCYWDCASYEGASPLYVSLNFRQNGKDAPWEFDNAVTMTSPYQCYN